MQLFSQTRTQLKSVVGLKKCGLVFIQRTFIKRLLFASHIRVLGSPIPAPKSSQIEEISVLSEGVGQCLSSQLLLILVYLNTITPEILSTRGSWHKQKNSKAFQIIGKKMDLLISDVSTGGVTNWKKSGIQNSYHVTGSSPRGSKF